MLMILSNEHDMLSLIHGEVVLFINICYVVGDSLSCICYILCA